MHGRHSSAAVSSVATNGATMGWEHASDTCKRMLTGLLGFDEIRLGNRTLLLNVLGLEEEVPHGA